VDDIISGFHRPLGAGEELLCEHLVGSVGEAAEVFSPLGDQLGERWMLWTAGLKLNKAQEAILQECGQRDDSTHALKEVVRVGPQ